jgi:predicted metal-dependent phosphoesterase TrpH
MDEFRADIHCHSDCSDGTDSPRVLLRLAKQAGLQGLSITDHDTMDAYTPEFFSDAEELGLQILTGIEVSSEWEDASVHILGYGYDLSSETLKKFLAEMQKRRGERNRAILKKLKAIHLPIEEEELPKGRTVGRPHIAQLMVKKGYVLSERDAFDFYLREGAKCYAPGIKFKPHEVIEEIHRAGGKAVLAHPHFMKKGSFSRQILSLPFDGIECYYAKLAKALELPWLKLAEKKGWIPTGGSDYHGTLKPHISLGCSWVNERVFELLRSKAKREPEAG